MLTNNQMEIRDGSGTLRAKIGRIQSKENGQLTDIFSSENLTHPRLGNVWHSFTEQQKEAITLLIDDYEQQINTLSYELIEEYPD